MCAHTPREQRGGLQEAFATRGPVLVDVVTDPNALSMPSHVTIGQVEGFSLAMGKIMLSGHIDEVFDTIRANIRNF